MVAISTIYMGNGVGVVVVAVEMEMVIVEKYIRSI